MNKDEKSSYLRGQAAMEYLMTYGLALFVIVIVLALLAFFLPSLIRVPSSCMFSQQGLGCAKHIVVYDRTMGGDRIIFSLENNLGQSIILERVVCTNVPSGEITKDLISGIGSPVPADQARMAAGTSKELSVPCREKSGGLMTNGPNSDFKGYVAFTYKYVDDLQDAPARIAVASVTGQVVESD